MPTGPVTASMRRTFDALEVSEARSKTPISPVTPTCVPPHSSREKPSPISTMRTTSPYFSPNSAIAPSCSRLVARGRDRAHAVRPEDPAVDHRLDVRELLGREPLAVGEVEAQLVGADVGAGLAYVGAEPLAQRRVQQVGGGVVALGGQPLARARPRR